MDPKVVVNGKEYPFVTEGDLTLGEAAELEKITGQGYDLTRIGALGLLALTYISVKRVDSSITVEDLRGLKAGDIDLQVEEADPVPPTSSGDSAGSATSGSESSSHVSDGSQGAIPEVSGSPV